MMDMIERIGGGCPVLPGTEVRVECRNGELGTGVASEIDWTIYHDRPRDVVAFEVITAGEFVKWGGGACPVDSRVYVEAKLKDGGSLPVLRAGDARWSHGVSDADIVEFRPVPTPVAPAPPAANLWDGKSLISIGDTVKQGVVIGLSGPLAWVQYKNCAPVNFKAADLKHVRTKYEKAADYCPAQTAEGRQELADVLQTLEELGRIKVL